MCNISSANRVKKFNCFTSLAVKSSLPELQAINRTVWFLVFGFWFQVSGFVDRPP